GRKRCYLELQAAARRRTGDFPVRPQAKPALRLQHRTALTARQPERSSHADAQPDKPLLAAQSLADRSSDRNPFDRYEPARLFRGGRRPTATRHTLPHSNRAQSNNRCSRIAVQVRYGQLLQTQAFQMMAYPVPAPAHPRLTEDQARLPTPKQVLPHESKAHPIDGNHLERASLLTVTGPQAENNH